MDPSRSDVRRRLRVFGVVQGVGFRPFVWALASELGLRGFVGNDSRGVFIEVEGREQELDAFRERLVTLAPPLAEVDRVESAAVPCRRDAGFLIVQSVAETAESTPVSPDVSICDACFGELMDPADRRYRYPFINCTNCGPRFTIIQSVPYDRARTTMRRFTMCAACEAEYHDPANRRFHAQPNACPSCGPKVWLEEGPPSHETRTGEAEAIERCRSAIAEGAIVAIKGIGGFHLACDATSDDACRRLRERKGRVDKPFALMARDLDTVRRFAELSDEAAAAMRSKERPIVLLPKRTSAEARKLSSLVAPGNRTLGLMLPYSPLHYLLVGDEPLVMTSGNRGEEPIAKDNDEARERLRSIADAFLLHDRDIEVACDDSVIRFDERGELPIRRSRGYAPFPLKLPLPGPGPSVLAVGGDLKATFCMTKHELAYLSQHVGDMGNLETLEAFERNVEHMARLVAVEPRAVACDRHPDYLSSSWARRYAASRDVPLLEVQHHHAHAASLMVENELAIGERVIALTFDGTGYGADGAVWGGEVLSAGYGDFVRLGHMAYVPLPGGDGAIKKPYRMALAYLDAAGLPWDERLPAVTHATEEERRLVAQQLERRVNCALTSSLGRLFDAVSALAGVRQEASYEGQAAMELEAVSRVDDGGEPYPYPLPITENESSPFTIDPRPAIERIVRDRLEGVSAAAIGGRFHSGLADMILSAASIARDASGLERVALTGGVFQNTLLSSLATERLEKHGFLVLRHRAVPPNDGGLALGQAAVAATIQRR